MRKEKERREKDPARRFCHSGKQYTLLTLPFLFYPCFEVTVKPYWTAMEIALYK